MTEPTTTQPTTTQPTTTEPTEDAHPTTAPAAAIEVRAVSKSFGATEVLRGVDLVVPDGGVTAILGASGSGKTTLLRLIAGFDTVDAGRISIAGRLVDDARRTVRAQHRGVGYVPQDAALFPHLTVAGNIGFGVARRDRAALAALIDTVGLTGLERRYPHQLSGGQQQRVALARALAIRPDVVLLDEPFGSLDATLRESVRGDVIGILTRNRTTTVLVTHDQDEAMSVADHIVLLDRGQVSADGSPRALYEQPPTPAVAAAIGVANLLTGEWAGGRLSCALGTLPVTAPPAAADGPCQLLLRPEQLLLRGSDGAGGVPGTVAGVRYHGHDTLLEVALTSAGQPLTARVAGPSPYRLGQPVWITTVGEPHVWS